MKPSIEVEPTKDSVEVEFTEDVVTEQTTSEQTTSEQATTAPDATEQMAAEPEPREAVSMTPETQTTDSEAMVEENDIAKNEPVSEHDEPSVAPDSNSDSPVRLYLPTTAGILLVDVDIRIGDLSLGQAHQRRIARVMADAVGEPQGDGDEAESLSWRTLFEYVRSHPEQFGNRQTFTPAQYKDMERRYDANRNLQPDHEEVARLVFGVNSVGGPFRLTGTDYYRNANRRQSKLLSAIDLNQDSVLEPSEIDSAERSLQRLDRNGDRRLDRDEVLPTPAANDPAWKRSRSSRHGQVAMDLEGFVDWSMMAYSFDSSRLNSPLGKNPGAVSNLDADQDGLVNKDEIQQLRTAVADLVLELKFDSEESSQPFFNLVSAADDVRQTMQLHDNGRSIAFTDDSATPPMKITFSAKDTLGQTQRIPLEAFEMLDANSDGGLDEKEFPDVPDESFSFERLDADGDGKVTLAEINRRRVDDALLWRVQVRARGAESRDAIFAWLDQDGDGSLSERELRFSGRRLNFGEGVALDHASLPDAYEVEFLRGDPSSDDQSFREAMPTRETDSGNMQTWARMTDSNQDGEISRGEFIGTEKQFDALDRDADGFITASEASVN
ncbi:EF-hand domain-containing protein [Stieleria varia]|uniref:EF-hand domain-containing protein n=1 Tax=Stieleria varia TaxID=2528005 RepID=UPI0018D21E9D|nr:hypothetical protein [Stieleria varia]